MIRGEYQVRVAKRLVILEYVGAGVVLVYISVLVGVRWTKV